MTRSPLLCVGSVALDTVRTPFGEAEDILGGSAVHFAAAASHFSPVQVVGVVGDGYPLEDLDFLRERGVDLSGVEQVPGANFRWGGEYSWDLSTRTTLFTELGVFEDFTPRIPDAFRSARLLFLGNIHPDLQADVLDQVEDPALVACDTMNYWIERTPDALARLLPRIDVLMINDEEARQLSGESNLTRAARAIRALGPEHLIVKKGENGAILFGPDEIFFVPAYPLDDVLDPTGAGDAFAGGFMGSLASRSTHRPEAFRRAVVHGCALGSFTVEAFGIDRLETLSRREIAARIREFKEMTTFDLEPVT